MKKNFYFSAALSVLLLFSVFSSRAIAETTAVAQPVVAAVKEQGSRIDDLELKLEELHTGEIAQERSLTRVLVTTGILIAIGIGLFILLKYGLKRFEEAISEKDAIRESGQTLRIKTIVRLFHWVGSIVIIGATFYMTLANIGIDVAPLLAGAGIIGLAFGFGGQYLVRDLINGIFILLEGHFGVNDIVKIGEYTGVVENINLRITTLRDAEGRVIIIPNGEIKTMVNLTKDFSRAVLSIGVAYKENIDHVMAVIKEVGHELRQDTYFGKLVLEDLEMQGVDDFAQSQVIIKFRIKTLPSKQFEVSREMRRRIKNRFDKIGIEIPFPHTTLYWGAGKDNDWFRNTPQPRA